MGGPVEAEVQRLEQKRGGERETNTFVFRSLSRFAFFASLPIAFFQLFRRSAQIPLSSLFFLLYFSISGILFGSAAPFFFFLSLVIIVCFIFLFSYFLRSFPLLSLLPLTLLLSLSSTSFCLPLSLSRFSLFLSIFISFSFQNSRLFTGEDFLSNYTLCLFLFVVYLLSSFPSFAIGF